MQTEMISTTAYTNPKNGEVIHSALDSLSARAVMRRIKNKSSFVSDILGKVYPTPGQLFWQIKLAEEQIKKENPAAPSAAPAGIVVGAFAKIAEMFRKASEKLKRPKILMEIGGIESKLSLAPSTGKNPGFIYLKVQGEYAGKISPDGVFSPFNCPETVKEGIKNLADNPASVAAAYGHQTGNCCFCARELTDSRSVTVGYGPICAGYYGLPWGEETNKEEYLDDERHPFDLEA
jgi:hypothetical protein